MTDMARQLLQELMGQYQDSGNRYTDANVCKDHLVDFCPNQLFTNTKADLGQCDLVHDDRLKSAYQKSTDRGRLGYEDAFYERLQRLTNDLQRRVRRAMDRVTTEADEQLVNPYKEEKEEKAIILDERIKHMLQQVQEHGENGRVLEAYGMYLQIDRLKEDLDALKQRIDSVNPMFKNEKRLEVCDICGAFLVPNDASKRLDAHKEGKQHQGYIKIRQALEEYKKNGGAATSRDSRGGDRWVDDRHGSGSRRRRYEDSGSRDNNRSRSGTRSRSPYSRRDRRGGNSGYDDRSNRDSSYKRRRDSRY
ncbi:splicing factor [Coemansia erecta]|uniref:Splicing factor n=1 Tax=Coemansia erecta TaxID=147472 RepID=A0A9W7Y0B3_9FUNG|nr:splicing factor [Coemansia erecta]